MASPSAARLAGDDYQHLFAWTEALQLLWPSKEVRAVIVEDGDAGSADDVSVLHTPGSAKADVYHQIKYHVDHRSTYSEETLLASTGGGRSLLKKWFDSWEQLTKLRPGHPVEIHIISTWTAEPNLGRLLSGQANELKPEFLTEPASGEAGQYRARWAQHVGATEERFAEFARALRIRLGYCCQHDLQQNATDRMELLGLKFDTAALLVAVSIVRGWVKANRVEIDRGHLEAIVEANGLRLPPAEKPSVTVHLVTIKAQAFEVPPDYLLDWRKHFSGPAEKKGHELIRAGDWNERLLPELHALESRINTEGPIRRIKVRGQARLSAWTAFGFVFSDVNRYSIEVDQQGQRWSTEAPRSPVCQCQVREVGPRV